MKRPGRTPIYVLVGSAIAAQIVYPLVSGSARDAVTVAVVVLLTAAALTHATIARGLRWALALFATTAGLGLIAEMIGTATGFPFGSYFYAADRLGPDIVGVPTVVPLAWTAGFYPVWCAVGYVLARTGGSIERTRVHRVLLTSVGMVGWDLYLDTQMVTDGQWTWTSTISGLPGLPSIPVSNYLGWFVVSAAMATIVDIFDRRLKSGDGTRRSVDDTAPLVLFLWTWIGSGFAHAALLDGPELRFSAIYGFVAMGVVGVPLLWAATSARRSRPAPPRTGTTP